MELNCTKQMFMALPNCSGIWKQGTPSIGPTVKEYHLQNPILISHWVWFSIKSNVKDLAWKKLAPDFRKIVVRTRVSASVKHWMQSSLAQKTLKIATFELECPQNQTFKWSKILPLSQKAEPLCPSVCLRFRDVFLLLLKVTERKNGRVKSK